MKIRFDSSRNNIRTPNVGKNPSKKTLRYLKSITRTVGRLERKRDLIASILLSKGITFTDTGDYLEVLEKGLLFCGLRYKRCSSTSRLHWYFSNIIKSFPRAALTGPRPCSLARTERDIQQFYRTLKWRVLRYTILTKYGSRCQCCGRTASDGVVICVDHKKPVRKFWHMRLDPENLQILCQDCNLGKGSWDQTDFTNPPKTQRVRAFTKKY